MKLEDIDQNFKSASVNGKDVCYYSAHSAPVAVEGFPWRKAGDLTFRRLPENITAENSNQGVMWLVRHTTGGAFRFRTDSGYIAIRAKLVDSYDMNHMPRSGSSGFDLYTGTGRNALFAGSAMPNPGEVDFERMIYISPWGGKKQKIRDFTINMPLYGGCAEVEIGLEPGAKLLPPKPHKYKDPILFYGHSITQGGCVSRPGNSAPTRLCRAVNAEQVNLGFSGSGRGEIAIANEIAKIPLTVFVMDYDSNAPSPEHLEATHEPFFKAIRAAQPDLPVIFLSDTMPWSLFPGCQRRETMIRRRDIIRRTYENALAAGDECVYFFDGNDLFGPVGKRTGTVDFDHPTDLGFDEIYRNLLPLLKKVLKTHYGK